MVISVCILALGCTLAICHARGYQLQAVQPRKHALRYLGIGHLQLTELWSDDQCAVHPPIPQSMLQPHVPRLRIVTMTISMLQLVPISTFSSQFCAADQEPMCSCIFCICIVGADCRINGLTHINLTKLDVLSDLETIKLGIAYNLDGKRITTVPAQLELLEAVTVEYEEHPGWQSDISKVSRSTGLVCAGLQ